MKKFNQILLFFFILTGIAVCQNYKELVKSPNGLVTVEFFVDEDGIPEYNILYKNFIVMKNNKLGLKRDDADFSKNLKLVSASDVKKIKDNYKLLHGKKINCSYVGNNRVFHLKNFVNKDIDIIFQVSDDGVAFRYFFPGKSSEIKKIIDECTYFNFDNGTIAWIQPIAAAKTGWNDVNPSYEEHYYQGDVKDLPNYAPGWVFPALFKSGNHWISLTETAPDRNYCGCRLIHDSTSSGFKIGFPQNAEIIFGGALKPESKLPWYSPWRLITLSDNLGNLIESTLGTDLAKPPELKNISFIKPGKSSWSWVLFKDDSTIYSVQKRFIDYASEMKWEYCLIDADWDRKIGYEKLKELCRYARLNGVGINIWYNSAGDWNTTPYTPRDKMLSRKLRYSEFKKLKDIGIKGIKVDFFGGDGQSVINYYQDIIEDAAHFGLMINCHGSTIPRGWHRTYPNLVSMESIRGFEFVTFDQYNADKEANHCTIIPFTRNLFDPMDFTPVCFSEVPNIQRRTSNSFELALSVLFLSGIQHIAEVPEGMNKVPVEIKEILKDIPVSWDETKFIEGYPGKYLVIARRHKKVWYVTGINGEQIERELNINLNFIKNIKSSLIVTSGDDNRTFEMKFEKIHTSVPLNLDLKPNDGFLIRLVLK
jgi:hypothetical protein